jgi:hypothetical protein
MRDDEEWLAIISQVAYPDRDDPHIQVLPLHDYQDALRYCRVYRLLSGNVPLDVSIKRSLRFEGDTRFVSYWIPSPWGVILFYGMFLRVSDRSVVSRSASLFSQDADAKPRVEAMCAQAHREYRDFITETHAIPTSLDGPETN